MNSDSWDDYGGESDFGDLKYGMVTFADLLSSLAQGISDDRDIFSFLAFDKNVKGLVSLSLSLSLKEICVHLPNISHRSYFFFRQFIFRRRNNTRFKLFVKPF